MVDTGSVERIEPENREGGKTETTMSDILVNRGEAVHCVSVFQACVRTLLMCDTYLEPCVTCKQNVSE